MSSRVSPCSGRDVGVCETCVCVRLMRARLVRARLACETCVLCETCLELLLAQPALLLALLPLSLTLRLALRRRRRAPLSLQLALLAPLGVTPHGLLEPRELLLEIVARFLELLTRCSLVLSTLPQPRALLLDARARLLRRLRERPRLRALAHVRRHRRLEVATQAQLLGALGGERRALLVELLPRIRQLVVAVR